MQMTITLDSIDELEMLRDLINRRMKDELPDAPPVTVKAPKQAETTVKGRNGKRVPIDAGKIKALRRAGWSVDKIADEMKCSVATVYNYLNK